MKGEIELVELVTGVVYFSADNWETVWRQKPTSYRPGQRGKARLVTDKEEADRARFLAIMQAGPGR
jgi:hypothetical protein